ncbi:HAMP domain-containing protein [Lentzea tibetensis]|uniref:histidine kinase n=2 Tax=Lentzea tibetensis TaxID=2591470 RepID=A0A563EGQ3_9PSEU|nr:HAMP domain-containing protein [Lentzea tibetensis]
MTTAAVTLVVVSLGTLADSRVRAIDQIEPASRHAQDLTRALLDQETGVRGFALTGQQDFLQPYFDGQKQQEASTSGVRSLIGDSGGALTRITEYSARWRAEYAEPAIERIRSTGPGLVQAGDQDQAKVAFDRIRSELTALTEDLSRTSQQAKSDLDDSAQTVLLLSIVMGAFLVLLIGGVALVLHRILVTPLAQLAEEVRQVASGEFHHEIDVRGPHEVVRLATDVNGMRRRIVQELSKLDEQSAELQRSNAELEQFAYVASHDLQEPLRKVASFCQLLQRRYGGQLDERADQYIEFAVDGAKRMQGLINDLLAFSRVGRITREHTIVDTGVLVSQVLDSYSERIEETGATITVGELPSVRGEASLLSAVFQNLVSNALKFRGERPEIFIDAARTDDYWTFTFRDNGIGIDSEYAERIFVIFQRLHPKDAYPGTGIGLAMCRKIIEYHGGTIRLKTDDEHHTTFEFTLPVVEETEETDD